MSCTKYQVIPGPALTLAALRNQTPEVKAKLTAIKADWNPTAAPLFFAAAAGNMTIPHCLHDTTNRGGK